MFLGSVETLPIIIRYELNKKQKSKLLSVLSEHKEVIGWSLPNIKGISLNVVMHRIYLDENTKKSCEPQLRLNFAMKDVVRAEALKLLNACSIYLIFDSVWVSPVHVVSKKSGTTVVKSRKNELGSP